MFQEMLQGGGSGENQHDADYGKLNVTTLGVSIDLGYKPTMVIVGIGSWNILNNKNESYMQYVVATNTWQSWESYASYFQITDNGFTIKAVDSSMETTMWYVAI